MSKILTDDDDRLTDTPEHITYALDGSDIVTASLAGPSSIYGGEGRDFLQFQGSDAFGSLYGGAGADTLSGATAGDSLYGEDGDDLLAGGEIDTAKFHANGTLALLGGRTSGDDRLDGSDGADALYGFDGADTLYGGDGNDAGTITVIDDTRSERTVTAGLFGGAGADVLDGGGGNDWLDGGSEGDRLIGGDGSDRLDGGTGADRMSGGAGDDTYLVDDAGDRVVEAAGDGTDLVLSSIAVRSLGANIENLTLVGKADLAAIGNGLSNTLVGNAGDNLIAGGAGNDILKGGSGRDTFFFDSRLGAGNVDHIAPFSVADDTIRLEDAVFKGLAVGPLQAGYFKDITSAATKLDATDRILYNHTTGVLSYDADGNGAQKAVVFAILDNHPSNLSEKDFFVV